MKNTNEHSIATPDAEIGLLAYQMWEKAGRPADKDLDFWLRAEEQIRKANKPVSTAPASRLRG
jgi:hypothetical protein